MAAAGCGGGHRKAAPPPRWVQRANAVCERDDPNAEKGVFDSAAMITGLEHEANDLARVGFFRRLPASAADVEVAGRLLFSDHNGSFGPLRKADRALIDARRMARGKGVRCSFAAIPLQNL
jgi:hypothetical protein